MEKAYTSKLGNLLPTYTTRERGIFSMPQIVSIHMKFKLNSIGFLSHVDTKHR